MNSGLNTTAPKDSIDIRMLLAPIFENTWEGVSGADLLERLIDFYQKIANELLDDLEAIAVFMARKAWCFFLVLFPHLAIPDDKREDIRHRIIHDGMLAPYFNSSDTLPAGMRVIIGDDSCVNGTALSRCVRRLIKCFGVTESNITVYAFSVLDTDELRRQLPNRAKREGQPLPDFAIRKNSKDPISPSDKDFFYVKWCGYKYYIVESSKDSHIPMISRRLVEAIAVSSVPYVSTTPAFSLTYDTAVRVFGSLEKDQDSGYIVQNSGLKSQLGAESFEFHNITTQAPGRHNVEAFILFPKKNTDLFNIDWIDWLPPCHGSAEGQRPFVRVYVNKATDKVLVIPTVLMPYVSDDAELGRFFPPTVSKLFCNKASLNNQAANNVMGNDLIKEGSVSAHKVLGYVASYCFGKHFLESTLIGLSPSDYEEIDTLGLPCDVYTQWLSGDVNSVHSILRDTWAHLQANNHIREHPPAIDNDAVFFETEFNHVFDINVPDTKERSYYDLSSALFRRLSDLIAPRFGSIPMAAYIDRLFNVMESVKRSGNTRNKAIATIVMLSDSGVASAFAMQNRRIIGTHLTCGEQSKLAIYSTEPAYAYFLSRLPEVSANLKTEKINILKDYIASVLEKLHSANRLGLPLWMLMEPVNDILNQQNLNPGVVSKKYYYQPHLDMIDENLPFFVDCLSTAERLHALDDVAAPHEKSSSMKEAAPRKKYKISNALTRLANSST